MVSFWLRRSVALFLAAWVWMLGATFQAVQAGDTLPRGGEGYARVTSENLLHITGLKLDEKEQALILQADQSFKSSEARNVSLLKLPNPSRLILEIPNAGLKTKQTVFPINRQGVLHIELSESKSRFYSSVRAVVYVSDSQVLTRLGTQFEKKHLFVTGLMPVQKHMNVATAPIPPAQQPDAKAFIPVANTLPPVPAKSPESESLFTAAEMAGKNVIQSVHIEDNRVMVVSREGDELRLKNRFTLSAPSRLVLDFDNAVLANRGLLQPIGGTEKIGKSVRIGQFDDETVRIVIETPNPEALGTEYTGSGRRQLAISSDADSSIARMSSKTPLGNLQDVSILKNDGQTILRIKASAPIVHRFIRKNDKVQLELLNVAASPTPVDFDVQKFPELQGIKVEPLAAGEPNSRLIIDLKDTQLLATPSLSDDETVLNISLGRSLTTPILIGGSIAGGAAKAPYPARIVIDAGHGGHDRGAIRQGVNEKDLNLSLAMMVKDDLEKRGFKVYMTRDTDKFLPLPEITRITNSIKPDLFISIHHNASTNPSMHGIETYFYTPQSRAFADRIHNRMTNNVSAPDRGVRKAMFYVIHHTNVPAVLCEVGYVSNPNELRELQTADRKSRTARSIGDGVVDYLKTRVSASAK